jgi:DNA-binding NtrC family response regulator
MTLNSRRVLEDLDYAPRITAPVLITHPNASRRRDLARSIHDHSCFGGGPFVARSCQVGDVRAGDPPFDVRRILQLSRGGTVFFDAIDRMPPDAQAELFAFLSDESGRQPATGIQRRERSVRVITGTNAPLLPGIGTRAFDEGLFYRLNVIHVDAGNTQM